MGISCVTLAPSPQIGDRGRYKLMAKYYHFGGTLTKTWQQNIVHLAYYVVTVICVTLTNVQI